MASVAAPSADHRLPVFVMLLIWLAAASAVALSHWERLDDSFLSPDNAMRLVEVRALIDGGSWFAPHEPRIAPPLGYDTHWSRLLDAGIAGLLLLLRQLFAPDLAERLARCIWPLLLSGPAVLAVAGIAVRLGGEGAGRATLLAALPSLALLPTFRPGEIDHHNAQLMLSLVALCCATWADRGYFAAAAGVAGGALLGIGLEAAYVPVILAATFGLLLVRGAQWAGAARAFATALALATLAAYALATPAALRFVPQCDALALNSALAVALGAGGLALVASFAHRLDARARLAALALVGGAALALFLAIEPRCLAGPFGLVDRTIFPLWMDQVWEMQPVAALFRTDGLRTVVYVGFPLVAALSAAWVAAAGLRTPLAWASLAAFAVSCLIMLGQVRIIMYVTWFGLPFVGVAAQRLAERTSRPVLVQIPAAVLASPAVVTLAVAILAHQVAEAKDAATPSQEVLPCYRPQNFAGLAGLPDGLVLSPLDLGPSVLAHTRHSVVGAPYHRADQAIRFTQEVMNGPSAAARGRVLARGVDYVVSCARFRGDAMPGSFHAALLAGAAGSWLEPVAGGDGELLKVWRVVR
jgi:hypothetical protein